MLDPRHCGNYADFFATPKQSKSVDLNVPEDLQAELEREAALAGRTWNDHIGYIVRILFGHQPPDFDDARSVEDWFTRMSPCEFRLTEAGDWIPFTCLRRRGHADISEIM